MSSFLLKRILSTLPVIVGVVTLVFLLIHFIPGDPVDMMLGDTADEIDKEALRQQLGLHLSLWQQYLNFWLHILDGSWGYSISYSEEVLSLILSRFWPTVYLSISGLLLAVFISVPLGLIAAAKSGKWQDQASVGFALLGESVPIFVLAPLCSLYLSVELGWFPVSGYGSIEHLFLPVLCLGFGLCGILTRMLRASILECLNEDFVRTAKAKGLGTRSIFTLHALRNALIPMVTLLGNMLGGLLAGAVITETLFDWPGIGKLFYGAFQSRDYPLVQGIVLWISVLYVLINFFVDIVYGLIDPRVRFHEET